MGLKLLRNLLLRRFVMKKNRNEHARNQNKFFERPGVSEGEKMNLSLPVLFVPAGLRGGRCERGQRGFTLIELMVVVAIVSILSAVAYPSYADFVRRAVLLEASEMLTASKMSMDQFYLSKRSFATASATGGPCVSKSGKSFTVACTWSASKPLDYTLTATGKTGTRAAGFTYTIDQTNTRTMASSVGGGWPATANCWLFKRGGVC
jgi:type IV pilus assembly protein PilE